jgi:hypothetical protein
MTDTDVPEEKLENIVERVIKAEDEKLGMKLPRGINEDIREIIEDEIK